MPLFPKFLDIYKNLLLFIFVESSFTILKSEMLKL